MFDADWVKNGYMEDAVKLMEAWAGAQPIPGMTLEVVRLEGRTPLIFIDIPASGAETGDDCVLLYGHLDKQPEMTCSFDALRPCPPVLRGATLYFRFGAFYGYAFFLSLSPFPSLSSYAPTSSLPSLLLFSYSFFFFPSFFFFSFFFFFFFFLL